MKPSNDLDGSPWWDKTENLGTPEKKDETIEIENLKNLRNKELIIRMKQE